jgi:glycosyltransferase involved in cell wall biosynthesis
MSKCICHPWEHKFNALLSRIDGIPFGGFYLANKRFYGVIAKFKPDIVHIHCINGFTINIYQLLRYLGAHHIKTVVTLHAEFFHTGGCAHAYECNQWQTKCTKCPDYKKAVSSWFFDRSATSWQKMNRAFHAFDRDDIKIVAVSPWLENRAQHSGILQTFDVRCIKNGVNTDIFSYRKSPGVNIISDKYSKTIVFVSAFFSMSKADPKGGCFLVELAKRCPNYRFVVVARGISCNADELPDNIWIYGATDNQNQLAEIYSQADLTLTLGRRETFSMIVAESLCCGTPIVGIKAGGPESIGMPTYSEFVDYANVENLKWAVEGMLLLTIDKEQLSTEAKLLYSDVAMAKSYCDLYQELINN